MPLSLSLAEWSRKKNREKKENNASKSIRRGGFRLLHANELAHCGTTTVYGDQTLADDYNEHSLYYYLQLSYYEFLSGKRQSATALLL